jgi:hypothetical protein
MPKTRRSFILEIAAAGSALTILQRKTWAQDPNATPGMPKPPMPADPLERDKNADPRDPRTVQKALLKENEKEFRAGVEKLYQMTGELKEELDKTPTTEVLSVRMYKKMQEIEKLAKQLKEKAKG